MKHDRVASGKRKAVNVSLDTGIVAAARDAGLNLSQICEAAIREAAKSEHDRRWKEANRAKMEAWNVWLDQNGLPYADLRIW